MDEVTREAYRHIIWSSRTSHPRDRAMQLIILRSTYDLSIADQMLVRQTLLYARFEWLNYLSMRQREWQCKTRNPNKARHHDSIDIRERYVRCH